MLKSLAVSTLALVLLAPTAGAQPPGLPELQRELTIFAGILEDSLRLNESTGLFGISLGGVEAIYLQGQGALFDIRSPLANRRNRMGLASLSSTMQALQMRQNPFEVMRRNPNQAISSSAPNLAQTNAGNSAYMQLLDRIAAIDYSSVAQNAIQQASQSARALRTLGTVDDAGFEQLNAEITQLRQLMDSSLQGLRSLEQEIREQIQLGENASADTDLSARLDLLLQSLEPVKERAVARAEALREQTTRAEREYAAQWQADLSLFREQLYQALCQYGTTLQKLPDNESISLVLQGLGEGGADNRRSDQIHIVSKADILACSRGEIDFTALQERAVSYTY